MADKDSPSVAEAIKEFKDKFNFHDRRNTEKTYKRAVDLLALFVMLGDQSPADPDEAKTLIRGMFDARETPEMAKAVDMWNYAVAELEPKVVADYHRWLKDIMGFKPRTVLIYEAGVRAALRYWRIQGWLPFSAEEERQSYIGAGTLSRDEVDLSERSQLVPDDFGEVMLAAANAIRPTDKSVEKKKNRLERLSALRQRALIYVLHGTGLRVSDVCRMKTDLLAEAKMEESPVLVKTKKTGKYATVYFNPRLLKVVEEYLAERNDLSPWVFVQHGRLGTRQDRIGREGYLRENRRRGYGAPISEKTAWEIVRQVALLAGYYQEIEGEIVKVTEASVSPHSFRHWFGKRLKRAGAALDDIQDALGHTSPVTTKAIYAPKPNKMSIRAAVETVIESGEQAQ